MEVIIQNMCLVLNTVGFLVVWCYACTVDPVLEALFVAVF